MPSDKDDWIKKWTAPPLGEKRFWWRGSEFLTRAEADELIKQAEKNSEYFRKAFAHLRPKKES